MMTLKSQNETTIDVAFRHSALGDLVLCTGFVKKHAEQTNNVLYFVTQPNFLKLAQTSFPNHPNFFAMGMKSRGIFGLFHAFYFGLKLAREIASKHQPKNIRVFDLHQIAKSHAFCFGFWIGSSSTNSLVTILKNNKQGIKRSLSVLLGKDLLGLRWIFEDHQKLLPTNSLHKPELKPPQPDPNHSAKTPLKPMILLAPAASKWKKEWPAAYWEQLIRRLKKDLPSHRLVVASPPEHPLTKALKDSLGTFADSLDWVNDLSTEELAGLALQASLCICSNSAWLHISEAVGVDVIAIQGPIVDGFGFSPWRERSQTMEVKNLHCRPCTKHGGGKCKLKRNKFHFCMTGILPEQVSEAAVKYFKDSKNEVNP